jgi:hypothetical protein
MEGPAQNRPQDGGSQEQAAKACDNMQGLKIDHPSCRTLRLSQAVRPTNAP